ncbi:hypothetical protein L6R49_10065 [Myxococcota bacterium]|nr:hypothetical protein [Myxococcota bacterium]
MATTAAELMLRLLREGAVPYLKGDEVALRGGGRAMPPELLAELKARREELRALLARGAGLPLATEDWPPDAAMELEERAAIMEFDGGFKRVKAEASAALATRVWWVRVGAA